MASWEVPKIGAHARARMGPAVVGISAPFRDDLTPARAWGLQDRAAAARTSRPEVLTMPEDASAVERTDVLPEPELMVSVAEAARTLGVTSRSVRRMVQDGRLSGVQDEHGAYVLPAQEVRRLKSERVRVRPSGRPAPTSALVRPGEVSELAPLLAQLGEAQRALGVATGEATALRDERDRLLSERDSIRDQLETARLEAAHADRELAVLRDRLERHRPWWRLGR